MRDRKGGQTHGSYGFRERSGLGKTPKSSSRVVGKSVGGPAGAERFEFIEL